MTNPIPLPTVTVPVQAPPSSINKPHLENQAPLTSSNSNFSLALATHEVFHDISSGAHNVVKCVIGFITWVFRNFNFNFRFEANRK